MDLKELKDFRDKLTHPKEIDDIIIPTFETFNKVRKVFNDYDLFFSKIVDNFFISTTMPL